MEGEEIRITVYQNISSKSILFSFSRRGAILKYYVIINSYLKRIFEIFFVYTDRHFVVYFYQLFKDKFMIQSIVFIWQNIFNRT